MFKKKEELDFAKVDTIIGKDTELNGNVNGKGILRVDGRLVGELNQNGDVFVGETGIIDANIKARHITIAGTVNGDIEGTGLLELLPTARLFGDIKVQNLSIGDGAVFKGSCEMKRTETVKELKADPNKK